MLFHLTDRIDGYVPGQSIRARKLTSRLETYWVDSPDGPVMPPALVLETLCQAGAWLVMLTTDVRRRATLLSLAGADFRGAVRPGDELTVEATVSAFSDEAAVMSGEIRVADRVVLAANDLMCALIDTGELDDPAATRSRLDHLTRAGARS
ncbi:hotdog domain-containing protein [Actinomycetes bacterium KLBMP 9797]